jgi:hypothetical protein
VGDGGAWRAGSAAVLAVGVGCAALAADAAGAAKAAPPHPARPSDAVAASAASTAIGPRFLARKGLKIRRFMFWSSFLS